MLFRKQALACSMSVLLAVMDSTAAPTSAIYFASHAASDVRAARQRSEAIEALLRKKAALLTFNANGVRVYAPNHSGPVFQELLFGKYHDLKLVQIELTSPQTLTEEDVANILIFKELDWLAISGSRITDKSLARISELTNLSNLDIEDCGVSKKAVDDLQQALPRTAIYSDYD